MTTRSVGLVPFTMRGTRLVEQGQTMNALAMAEHLWVHAKIYQGGGENGLHCHSVEDHAFFILSGSATFFDETGTGRTLHAYDGIMIPKGTLYRFEACAAENLVMIRVGASPEGGGLAGGTFPAGMDRRGPGGAPFTGDSADNGTSSLPTILSERVFDPAP
jgi:mannose-6-phosphate isomerase-like protein (cupin superfamily)